MQKLLGGNGATIKCMPHLNMLALCGVVPPILISIFDCSDHMSEGEKRMHSTTASYQGQSCQVWYNIYMYWCILFVDTSNAQKAGEILCATYAPAFCFHGGKHIMLSLFFSDLANFRPIKVSASNFCLHFCCILILFQNPILKTCRLYNVFESDANHGIHAQFMTQASALNNGKRIGLLRGAGTRFATWFYALHGHLRQKMALYATVHSPAF